MREKRRETDGPTDRQTEQQPSRGSKLRWDVYGEDALSAYDWPFALGVLRVASCAASFVIGTNVIWAF